MQQTRYFLILLTLLCFSAHAEDPALPPNPFQNIPTGSDDPFSDEFDDGGFDEAPAFPNGAGANNAIRPSTNDSAYGGNNFDSAPTSSRSSGGRSGGSKRVSSKINNAETAKGREVVESFDYPDSEILDVAKAISKLTGKNFIYNPQDIKGRISIVSNTAITVSDAYNAFLAALNMKGFALVPSGQYLRIERVGSAKEKQTPIYSEHGAPSNEEFITRVVPLRYIDASEVEQTFRMWMPREARLQAYAQTNTLIITDTAVHINRMMQLISLLDVAGYQESLAMIQIHNSTAKDIAKLIEQIITDNKNSQQNRFGMGARPAPTFGTTLTHAGGTGRQGGMQISKIIADDRTNTLIIKANAVGIAEIRSIVRKLDTKTAPAEGSGRIHVVRLQFANAEEIAKTLGSITQNASRSSSQSRYGFSPIQSTPENSQVFQGDIKVSPDKFTQSLVITASPQDFSTLRKVIETLDVPRDQVFVESIIMEVALGRGKSFGTSFISAPNGMALGSASKSLQNVLGGGNPLELGGLVLGFKSGESRDFQIGTGDNAQHFKVNTVNGLVDFISSHTDSNVIATPQLIALDNQDSEITIGDSIPESTGTTTTSSGVTTAGGFTTKEANLHLKVKPQINKGSDFVKLDIEQTLESFSDAMVPKNLQGTTTGKTKRETKTSVIVENEDTVVISGLIRDAVTEITNKIPILGDIPILGWLFKNRKTDSTKTNLLVFITPRIIKQYDAVRKILESRLKKRDDFIHENVGSQDPMRTTIDEIKASLPPLNKLSAGPELHTIDSKSFNAPTSSQDDDSYGEPEPWDGTAQPFITPPMDNIPSTPINTAAPPPVMPQDGSGGYQ